MMPFLRLDIFTPLLKRLSIHAVGCSGKCNSARQFPLQNQQIVDFDQKNHHCEQGEQKSFNPFEVHYVN